MRSQIKRLLDPSADVFCCKHIGHGWLLVIFEESKSLCNFLQSGLVRVLSQLLSWIAVAVGTLPGDPEIAVPCSEEKIDKKTHILQSFRSFTSFGFLGRRKWSTKRPLSAGRVKVLGWQRRNSLCGHFNPQRLYARHIILHVLRGSFI